VGLGAVEVWWSVGRTITKYFNHDPFWFIITVLILLQVGSCSVRNIYCDWTPCEPKKPSMSLWLGEKGKKINYENKKGVRF